MYINPFRSPGPGGRDFERARSSLAVSNRSHYTMRLILPLLSFLTATTSSRPFSIITSPLGLGSRSLPTGESSTRDRRTGSYLTTSVSRSRRISLRSRSSRRISSWMSASVRDRFSTFAMASGKFRSTVPDSSTSSDLLMIFLSMMVVSSLNDLDLDLRERDAARDLARDFRLRIVRAGDGDREMSRRTSLWKLSWTEPRSRCMSSWILSWRDFGRLDETTDLARLVDLDFLVD